MAARTRPLSPHLQVYRPQITSVLSILHRGTGIAVMVGSLMLTCWLVSAAAGPTAHETLQVYMSSFLGRLVLFGWTFALFYHLCNGVRHLLWDAGWGFELKQVDLTGWTVVAAAAVLTVAAWVAAYAVWK